MLTDRKTVFKVNRVVIYAVAYNGMPSIHGNVGLEGFFLHGWSVHLHSVDACLK